jgi:putative membrane protein insertion efficiency factor
MDTPLSTLPRRALMALVRGYRLILSPWLGNNCRFDPTCSDYSLQALERHGAIVGTYMTIHRIVRCHPFCAGGHDPVPGQAPALFRHLFTSSPKNFP